MEHSKVESEFIFQARNLGDIICDNTDISEMRSNVFSFQSGTFECVKNAKLDLHLYLPPTGANKPKTGNYMFLDISNPRRMPLVLGK